MPVSLELGGKSATMVLQDADLDHAVNGVLYGIFSSSGESCIAGSRLFVARKLYGEFGYIDMVPEPDINPIPGTDKVDFTLNVDEGKQFFVRRIDFSGNTTTRDKVIRRELLVDEGDMFSTRLWELSILRLNQLGYFDALKQEEAAG